MQICRKAYLSIKVVLLPQKSPSNFIPTLLTVKQLWQAMKCISKELNKILSFAWSYNTNGGSIIYISRKSDLLDEGFSIHFAYYYHWISQKQ